MINEIKLEACPFCSSQRVKYFNGWAFGDRERDPEHNKKGRHPSITCEECGIGVTTGFFGYGVSDQDAKEITIIAWNRRPPVLS